MPDTAPILRIDLAFARQDFALRARADLNRGVTGICGPSGCGKSTLLALLSGLLPPRSGTLHFENELLNDAAHNLLVPPWRRHFGLVFQEGFLFPHLSVRNNLLYGARRLPSSARTMPLEAIVALLELETLLHRRPAMLSGGERQRVALGRALLYSPRLLLLDEPLSSLDQRLKEQILPFLKRVKDEIRTPMIYVSHDQREVEFLADQVLWMSDGKLAATP